MNRQRLAIKESDELSEIGRGMGWNIQYDQTERGRFAGNLEAAETGEAQFIRERHSRALSIHGTVPAGMVAFLLSDRAANAVRFCGRDITPAMLCALTPGDEGALRTPAGYDFINCCFARERLDRALGTLCQSTLDRVLPRTSVVAAPPPVLAALCTAAQTALAPLLATDELLDPAAADRAVEERVLSALCTVLTAGDPPRPAPLAARNHWRCVRAVRNYVDEHLGQALGMKDLCRVTGVSERTLHTAFRVVTGLSPQQFIKTRRLAAARRALATARKTEIPIKSVALDLGFWHLGYFARDYKAHFGESPSQTLARR